MRVLAPLAVAVAMAAVAATPAAAATCGYPQTYPGDDAPRASVAGWMAGAAKGAGIPGELPVMASLADTGLQNLQSPDVDSAGYFQMRIPIWDSGEYEGFPDHPTLQLQWFIDHALAIRQQRIAAGNSQFGSDPALWGEWIADVQRPAEQYRGRYQLRLEEARSLIAAGCVPEDGGSGGGGGTGTGGGPAPPDPGTGLPGSGEPDLQLFPESILPQLTVKARGRQNAARARKLVISARCANEACFTRARGTVAVPGRGLFKLETSPRQLKRGSTGTFELPLGRRLRRLVAASLRAGHKPLAAIRVTAANAGGYRTSRSRTVRLVASGTAATAAQSRCVISGPRWTNYPAHSNTPARGSRYLLTLDKLTCARATRVVRKIWARNKPWPIGGALKGPAGWNCGSNADSRRNRRSYFGTCYGPGPDPGQPLKDSPYLQWTGYSKTTRAASGPTPS